MSGHWKPSVGGTIEGHFWLRGQPLVEESVSEQQAHEEAITVDGRQVISSEIYRYKPSPGSNLVQWFNWLEDGAAILISSEDGTGYAEFHAWIAPPSGAAPFEVKEIAKLSRYNTGNRRIAEVQASAVKRLCEMTALPVPFDYQAAVEQLGEKQ